VDEVTEIEPPPPAILDGPGVVRFAAGSESGPRSLTWRVSGVSNSAGSDDIYVGTRQTMGNVKISLHDVNPRTGEPPRTILRFTHEFREANQLPNAPLAIIEQAALVAPGWRHELTIATPSVTFGTFAETPPLKPEETVQWWTPEQPPHEIAFHLYVGDSTDRADLTINNHIGEVAQIPMSNGRCLWIIANSEVMSDEVREAITQHVAGLSTDPTVGHPFTLTQRGDGVPVLLDLAAVHRPPPE
jgi:hypothetical protein